MAKREYKLHPLCEKFPSMPPEEFRELVEDIRANGQREPVWTFGKFILDGKHRLDACKLLGREPETREFRTEHGPEEPQLKAFVLSKNFYRRHLNSGQRALLVAEFVTTEKSGRLPETSVKHDKTIVSESTITQSEAAAAAGVSRESVNHAAAVLESGSAALVGAVRDGDITLTDAKKIVDLPKSEQTAAVKKVEKGEARTVAAAAREPGEDPPEPKHVEQLDHFKKPVPERLREVFAEVTEFNKLRKLCADIKSGAKGICETKSGGWLKGHMQELEEHCDQIKRLVRFAAPHTECAKCKRKPEKKCPACKGTGWVTEQMMSSSFSDADKTWLESR